MDTPGTPCANVHVWGHDSLVAFAKAVIDAEERGVLRDARVTEDRATFGHPMHVEVRTTDESGKTMKPFNDIWVCPPWPIEFCDGSA